MLRIAVLGVFALAAVFILLVESTNWSLATDGHSITTVDDSRYLARSSLAIGVDGLPVIAYRDTGYAPGLKIMHCGNQSCTSGNTTNIVDESEERVVWGQALAIGSDGNPVVAYWASDAAGGFYLRIVRCGDIICSFENSNVLVDGSTKPLNLHVSIAIGVAGNPVVSYTLGLGDETIVISCGNQSCSAGNVTSTLGKSFFARTLAIGSDGNPVISGRDGSNDTGNLRVIQCGNPSCSLGNVISTVDSAGEVGFGSSLAIGTDGKPVISYLDYTNLDLKVVRCGNLSCSAGNTITAVDTVDSAGYYPTLAIGSDGKPIIAYTDVLLGDLKIAHCGNSGCTSGNTITRVDTDGKVGWHPSLAVGVDGKPVVSYTDLSNDDIKVARCGNIDCTGKWPRTVTVLLVHGYDLNKSNKTCGMESIGDWLESQSYTAPVEVKTECLWYRTRDGVIAGAMKLRQRIDDLGVDQVDIVAHSMGGLVARWYIEHLDGGHESDVRSLTMLGTPNLGTESAIPLCGLFSHWISRSHGTYDQGACDLVPDSPLIKGLNSSNGAHGAVAYHITAGWIGNLLLPLPNDCTVPVASAIGLGFPSSLYGLSHVSMGGNASLASGCIATGLMDSGTVRQEVANILLASNGLAGSPAQRGAVSGAPPPDEPAMSALMLTSGAIAQGETVTIPVTIPAGETTAMFVFRSSASEDADLTYTLLRPGGAAVIDADPDAELLIGSAFENIDQSNYTVTSPAAGIWTLRIDGTTVPTGGWPYEVEILVDGRIAVSSSTDGGHYDLNEAIEIGAIVTIDELATTANVDVMVTKPDGTTVALQLTDDGSGGYTGSFSDTAQCGAYQAVVTAGGLDGATPFVRYARTLFVAAVAGNEILDPCVADSDGDGLTDDVELTVHSTDPANADTDGDSCDDGAEVGTDETLGGLRDPLNPWDFYDVLGPGAALPVDGVIDLPNDILGVILHFSPQGQAPYDAQFDRGPSIGPNPWNMTAPDGVIDLPNDILGVILQFNHRCV